MSEAQATQPATTTKPAPRDKGFKGRKFVAGMTTAGSIFATSTVGWLVLDKMTAPEWIDAMLWLVIPTVLITAGLITAEKALAFRKGVQG